ncbi:hypothetical protein BCL52_1757 [Salisediminibacterium halotolerans]|uniref:Uncharacterized protein n=1 Tax=Salisediminibacterium halotolerans TaxID=517425 RepID=A0A1H9VF57_9BACI|nr:hypothetical protein BCL39_1760 [Actinophytocola xinjiangensis]RPE87437.1 hypothetical protein EDD67_1171 [Salisediminibacterium halotolerans]TWG35306.1 hypothetical protein BCL52_1757 [Salisediminibacterium halotolerans]SES20430.1 hypothetical protein SAMN05444126_12038 [Salisediminibacterium haloalkalitolerans]
MTEAIEGVFDDKEKFIIRLDEEWGTEEQN